MFSIPTILKKFAFSANFARSRITGCEPRIAAIENGSNAVLVTDPMLRVEPVQPSTSSWKAVSIDPKLRAERARLRLKRALLARRRVWGGVEVPFGKPASSSKPTTTSTQSSVRS